MEQNKQIKDDYSKLNVLGKSLKLESMSNKISENDDEIINVGEITTKDFKILDSRMFDAIKIENKLYNRNILKMDKKLKEKNNSTDEKGTEISFSFNNKKKSKTYKNIGYLSEKNKGISNIKLREKKNNNLSKININYGSIPETLQQSEIYQYGGALPEYVDLTIERLSQTLFNWINSQGCQNGK